MNKLKVAIITGGRRGIGFGIVKKLLELNYYVVLSAYSSEADEALNQLKQLGFEAQCEYISCDISDDAARKALIHHALQKHGRIDILVNCAGVAPKARMDILQTTQESFDFVMNTNARATFFMCQMMSNIMIQLSQAKEIPAYSPRIINISSISAYTSSIYRGEYCISKAAISMVTKLFADRLSEHNIPVFEVRPGIIRTDMTAVVESQYNTLIDDGLTPIRRFGEPEDVANCVAAACSGLLDFATGQVLNADGGFSIRRL